MIKRKKVRSLFVGIHFDKPLQNVRPGTNMVREITFYGNTVWYDRANCLAHGFGVEAMHLEFSHLNSSEAAQTDSHSTLLAPLSATSHSPSWN
jgi:hypothetical protein